ncbi:hypothetical protein [Mycobacterium asiaticum]|uniref:Uncharacterized protein n=1 Tax=Mycobacterium asiaticum TaxID=1790 RepID=A0A1A3N9W8_MYCAS|nr:hypothetical protein [Mycobacterium asiaticum]OBK18586.1 hypothetical protein A5636_20260 [Mycobacterium asiaticum]
MGSAEVYSEGWWADHDNENRCVAHSSRTGDQCLKAAIRGGTVCRFHGGAAGHVKRKAKERLELAADRMARELLGMATGAESEAVKLNAIRDALDRAGLGAKSEVSVELRPWEQLMGNIAGVATISRAEHLARNGAYVIDAEVVEPADESDPARDPERTGNEMRDAETGDVPGGEMPPASGGLMTLEDAAEARRQARKRSR